MDSEYTTIRITKTLQNTINQKGRGDTTGEKTEYLINRGIYYDEQRPRYQQLAETILRRQGFTEQQITELLRPLL